MIKAEIVAHSLTPQGNELISVLATFPRIILAEVNTHRMLSKNTSSSRAIPFAKMVEMVKETPFIPMAWQKSHSGMQGTEYFTDKYTINLLNKCWKESSEESIIRATDFNLAGVTKQLCNRLLEPFSYTTMLITGSIEGWENFFKLRCPQYNIGEGKFYRSKKDAIRDIQNRGIDTEVAEMFTITDFDWLKANKGMGEIHIMDLAEKIWDARNESTPEKLEAGEWHIPFLNKMQDLRLKDEVFPESLTLQFKGMLNRRIKASVGMAARTSYTVVGGEKELNFDNLIGLHDRLLTQDPPHSSPFEHAARCMSNDERDIFVKGKCPEKNSHSISVPTEDMKGWCANFKGFIPYRYLVDNNIPL